MKGYKATKGAAKIITADYVEVQNHLFEMQGFDKDAPLGYIKDITKMVDAMLDGSKEKGLLSWHSGIPEEEVWIKIGGDHGVNSLKLTLQIVNTEHPNSKRNTIVIAMAQVRDTHTNLERLFENMHLQEQILALQDHKWQGKSMKIFLNGDYEFLTNVYGLSGASGTFPCLWCLVQRQDIQLDNNNNNNNNNNNEDYLYSAQSLKKL